AESGYRERTATLSWMFLGPVADQLGDKRLLIVAEGALEYLPFQSLPVPTPEKGDAETRGREDAMTPLVVEHEIVNLPSASVLAVLRDQIRDRQSAHKAVAVIADPVFEADDPRVIPDGETRGVATPPRRRVNLSPLPMEASDLHRALRDVGMLRDGGLSIPRLMSSRQEADAIIAAAAGAGMKSTDFNASRATVTSPELGQYRI